MSYALTDQLRLPAGAVTLDDLDPASTPGFDGGKRDAEKSLRDLGEDLRDLQERMFAQAYTGGSRRVHATSPESTLGAGQKTLRPIEPARLTSAYQAAFTEGTP